MNFIIILIGLVILVIGLELLKHHVTKRAIHYIILGVIIIIALLFISAYIDLGTFFNQDNGFAQTGRVVADNIGEDLGKINFKDSKIIDSIEEEGKKAIEQIGG